MVTCCRILCVVMIETLRFVASLDARPPPNASLINDVPELVGLLQRRI